MARISSCYISLANPIGEVKALTDRQKTYGCNRDFVREN